MLMPVTDMSCQFPQIQKALFVCAPGSNILIWRDPNKVVKQLNLRKEP